MEHNSLLRADKELADMYQRNVDMIYRLCYMYLKNSADAEDAVQVVFIKFMKARKSFNDKEHEKAWFIKTTRNYCNDTLKSWWNTRRTDFEELPEIPVWDDNEQTSSVRYAMLSLPEKYKTVLYLHYFEGYSVKEMVRILNRKGSTLQTQLAKGRELLKIDLGGNYYE